jgi:hypothetical protein
MLREVEEQTALLSAVPSMQQRTGSGTGTPAFQRVPVRLTVVALLDPRTRPAGQRPPGPACAECWHDSCVDIRAWIDAYDAQGVQTLAVLDVLHSWARVVREERSLSEPGTVTVSGERNILTRWLEWVAEQPWLDEMYQQLRDVLSQLKGVNGTSPDKPVGRCYLIGEDGQCRGMIRRASDYAQPWHTLTDRCVRRDVETADGHAYCDECGQTWDGPRLAALQWELEEAKRPRTDDGHKMRTAEEIMRDLGLTRSAFDVRAHRMRRAGLGGQSKGGYYDPRDFQRRAVALSG